MRDVGNEETEVLLKKVERKVERTYKRAARESGLKLQEYLQQFEKEDIKKQAEVEAGKITEEAYKKWRKDEMLKGKRWEEMLNTLADDYVHADQIAMSIVNGYIPEAYAINRNFAAFEVEKGALVDTSFTLYNRETVERLLKTNPKLLPKPRVNIPKDRRWNKRKIREEITQGILQGEPIPKVSKRLKKVAGMDNAAAIRNARTAITGAQNAGRLDQYKAASEKGIDMMQKWVATLDHRTRDSHAIMDGELINVGGTFSNGLRFPGDPLGEPEEVYNCRCRMVGHLMGFSFSNGEIPRDNRLGEIGYDEWKASAREKQRKMGGLHHQDERITAGYTGTSHGGALNDSLRKGFRLDDYDKEIVKRIDENMEEVKNEITLFRGTGPDFIGDLDGPPIPSSGVTFDQIKEMIVGRTFENAGYTSTSYMETTDYGHWYMRIKCPKGTKALWSANDKEHEVILGRNQKFKILSYERENKDDPWSRVIMDVVVL